MSEIVVGIDDSAGARGRAGLRNTGRRGDRRVASTRVGLPVQRRAESRRRARTYREYLRADAQSLLDRAAAGVEGIGDRAPRRSPTRRRRARCTRLAERIGAALVVVGSTRRGPVGRVVPGSTGERLLHGSPCPVAIVPRGYARGRSDRTVGVGYDGSDESEAALAAACQVARTLRCRASA